MVKMHPHKRGFLAAVAIAIPAMLLGFVPATHADSFTFTLSQVGSNVVLTGSGSIDLTDLTAAGLSGQVPAVFPGLGIVSGGGPAVFSDELFSGISGPTSFGPGGVETGANSATGDPVFINGFNANLGVPTGYVSGSALSDTATFDSATLASLGVTPGTYTWTYGTGADAGSITLVVATAMPEPSGLTLLGIGLLSLIGVSQWRRHPA